MTNVLTEICNWATALKYWEQAALDKIMTGVRFTESDYDELLQYLLEDAKLEEPIGSRPALHFSEDADADAQSTGPVRLVKISNLQSVNALVSGQTLTFGPALTAIYGGNGSGKSGYARVLGCAGFTRGDKEVLPDVTQPVDDTVAPSADIEVAYENSNHIIPYQVGRKCPELASFYVFDSTSVRVHLTESNSLSFSPAGLSYLTRLAEVTDEVRGRLKAKIEEYSQPHCFDVLFPGDSEVSELIATLGPDTDLEALRQMATLSPEQQEQIHELDLKIAHLKTQDIPKQIGDLKQRIEDLENLVSRLCKAQEGLSNRAVDDICKAMRVYIDRQSAAQRVSVDQFKSEHLTQTGSDVWYRFIEAARALADAEQTPEGPYPQADSRCLLCQQPLSVEARELLMRLWEFLEGEAQTRLEKAQALLAEKCSALSETDLDFFDEESVSYRYLQEHNPELLEKVKTFITACCRRRESVCRMVADHAVDIEAFSPPDSGISDVRELINSLKESLKELEDEDPTKEIAKLEQQMRGLQHRELLGQHLSEIEDYVQKRIWAKRADRSGGSTRHITGKYNQLFGQLVTNRYVELFEQTLEDLGRPLKVRIETRGRKGEVYKQIALEADASILEEATPDKVLSEGEKRAVALADFLTEVALDTTSSGIILDDPVTSLDLEWRELIASILAAEAKRRQVIVFTHDLPFLYHLKKHSEQEQMELATHWIKRGETDDKPGYVFLDNSPALERDYRSTTRAHDIYKEAKDAPPERQETLLREGFGVLRACYEAFIIFELFNEVVMRFEERVSFGRLSDIVWDESIVHQVIAKCELLSRYIEGHLHSNALGAQKPAPKMLCSEIEDFDAIKKSLKNLKKMQ